MYLTKKKIKGKEYIYLVKSIRLPNGKVHKIQKLVESGKKLKNLKKKFKNYFKEKEIQDFQDYALKTYSLNSVFTKEQIKKVEKMKVEYSWLLNEMTKNQLQDLFDRFTVNFTYESNAIEGNSLTLKDVAIVIFEKIALKNKDLREIYETRNSRKVVDLILKKKFKVEEKGIIKMHKMLIKDLNIMPGYKKFPNTILGHNLKITSPKNVPEEMKNLIKWYKKEKNNLHPVQVSALFHGKFEKIHPFEDGNGRVGRFLSNIILVNAGYPPLIIRKTQRTAYLKTLQDFDNGYFINTERFFLKKYKKTFEKFFQIYIEYL